MRDEPLERLPAGEEGRVGCLSCSNIPTLRCRLLLVAKRTALAFHSHGAAGGGGLSVWIVGAELGVGGSSLTGWGKISCPEPCIAFPFTRSTWEAPPSPPPSGGGLDLFSPPGHFLARCTGLPLRFGRTSGAAPGLFAVDMPELGS